MDASHMPGGYCGDCFRRLPPATKREAVSEQRCRHGQTRHTVKPRPGASTSRIRPPPLHPATSARENFLGSIPKGKAPMTDDLRDLSVERLEEMLLEASLLPGRAAMARVTAIRTILARRPQRTADEDERD